MLDPGAVKKILVIFSNDRVYTSYFWVPQNVKKTEEGKLGPLSGKSRLAQ